ncbi:MAG TPA: hypothetical protein VNT01_13475 [Symbiobacteriaceae bacterium]|nr:hypothetical protein [Symbiobacteriaceae bacterium]
MRYSANEEVCITTIMVRGPVSPWQAEQQHRLLTQAVMGKVSPRRREVPRALYLGLAVLFLAGAVFFFRLAVK